jgi:hypothetical protein
MGMNSEVKDGGFRLIPNELKIFVYGLGVFTMFAIVSLMAVTYWRIMFEPSQLMCAVDFAKGIEDARQQKDKNDGR